MSDPRTLAVYDAQADDYETMMNAEAQHDTVIGPFIAACRPGGHILDLGCGPGNFARMMAAAGLQVTALDASAAMVERAGRVDGVIPRHATFHDVTETAVYDGIWAYFSLLHALREEMPDHLARLHAALRPAGVFYIGMKTGTGGGRDPIDRHYQYYSPEELETLLTDAGFTTGRSWTGYGKGLSGQYSGWIAIAAHA